MGWMQVIGNCAGCNILFSFNATHVPSVRIDGVKEPVCKDCMNRMNVQLVARGHDPVWIHPDAYEPQEVD